MSCLNILCDLAAGERHLAEQDRIPAQPPRPVGRPPHDLRRYFASFGYQAQSWEKPRRVVAKVDWHPGELYSPVSFTRPEVTNGPFLSHKGTERERRCAGVAEIRRKRRLSLRTALTGNRWFPTRCATTLQTAENWQPIVFLGHHASPVPPISAYA
jgi:hypothetical protein